MRSKVFTKKNKNKVYEFEYSDEIRKICKPYRMISNVAWIIVIIALMEPRILLPSFLISLLMFLSERMKMSWRVSTFLEKIKNGRFEEGKKILVKLENIVDKEIYTELKRMLKVENSINI